MKNHIQFTKQAAPEGTVYKGDAYIMTVCAVFMGFAFVGVFAGLGVSTDGAVLLGLVIGAVAPWVFFHAINRLWSAIRARRAPA